VGDGPASHTVLVAGVGNAMRRDDGAGLAVARRVRELGAPDGVEVRAAEGEPVGLLELWDGRDAVVLVDAMRSGAAPGTVRRLDASAGPLPRWLRGSTSTHAVALAETVELARALGRLPPRVVVYAVEGERFDAGAGLSDGVAAAVERLGEAVLAEAAALAAAPRGHPTAMARPEEQADP
jgi:hydrogenase maturation protease